MLYSFLITAQSKKLGNMNPFFITGFTDGEGPFTLSIRSSDKYTSKWKIQYAFQTGLHKKDIAILEKIQQTLGVGKLYTRGEEGWGQGSTVWLNVCGYATRISKLINRSNVKYFSLITYNQHNNNSKVSNPFFL